MYHVSAQGIDERMINVHYYYYYMHALCPYARKSTTQNNSALMSFTIRYLSTTQPSKKKINGRWEEKEIIGGGEGG